MKKYYFKILSIVLLVGVLSCNSQKDGNRETTNPIHREHNNLADNFTHKDIIILDTVYKTSDSVSNKFREVLGLYFQLADAMVEEDLESINQFTGLMALKIETVPLESFIGDGLLAWTQHSALYEEKLREMRHANGLDQKRSYFSHISEIMYCTIKSFNFQMETLYVVFCPMAFDGKGAYWMSQSKAIRNPYVGKEMADCGNIKEEIF
jgi:hypothetical protein